MRKERGILKKFVAIDFQSRGQAVQGSRVGLIQRRPESLDRALVESRFRHDLFERQAEAGHQAAQIGSVVEHRKNITK